MQKGDIVHGRVIEKVRDGLLVDIGVHALLPTAEIDLEPAADLDAFVGRELESKVIRVEEPQEGRPHVILSRKRLLEDVRKKTRKAALEQLQQDEVREGTVTRLTPYGAFIDLGGIEGLLRIADISWEPIRHPADLVHLGDRVRVKILEVNRTQGQLSLGLKQLSEHPWIHVPEKYPVGTRAWGVVLRFHKLGAFLELEPGVQGLLPNEETSWTRKVRDASEFCALGDRIEVVVTTIDPGKLRMTVSAKRAQENPWERLARVYPPGAHLRGKVRRVMAYGAFVEIDKDVDGMVHVSDLSWTRKVGNAHDAVEVGQEIEVVVLSFDVENRRISLGHKQRMPDPWESAIPDRYKIGTRVTGKVKNVTSFGAFVELEPELDGLLHVSAVSTGEVPSLENLPSAGDLLEVAVLRVDAVGRKIGLSLVKVVEKAGPPAGSE